jgi:hypothetical protein
MEISSFSFWRKKNLDKFVLLSTINGEDHFLGDLDRPRPWPLPKIRK